MRRYYDETLPVVNVLIRKVENLNGSKPASREQFGLVYNHGFFYMFGGSSQQAYNDLRKFDLLRYEWTLFNESKTYQPDERFGHTFNKYRNLLIVFGGAGHFN